jgi:hypothetical protein
MNRRRTKGFGWAQDIIASGAAEERVSKGDFFAAVQR